MAMDAGASGFFGLLLSKYGGLADICRRMYDRLEELQYEHSGSELDDILTAEFLEEVCRALKDSAGIVVPTGAVVLYTGDSDDRPGRCTTPAEEFGVGFGMFMKPWQYPAMDDSFKHAADFHTWCWFA